VRTVSVVKASESLGKYAQELKREIVVMTRGKRALAALVPLHHVDPESIALSMHPGFLALVKKARAELGDWPEPLTSRDASEGSSACRQGA
jgi:hypothetical protein